MNNTARLRVVDTHYNAAQADRFFLTPVSREVDFSAEFESKADKIQNAINQLKALKAPFTRPGEYHIKAGRFNFFPTSGKITVDGIGAVQEKGLDFFIEALRRQGMIRE